MELSEKVNFHVYRKLLESGLIVSATTLGGSFLLGPEGMILGSWIGSAVVFLRHCVDLNSILNNSNPIIKIILEAFQLFGKSSNDIATFVRLATGVISMLKALISLNKSISV